jgi:predicted HNH restriction endonuclease
MNRISESELILPALFVLSSHGGSIGTSTLIAELRALLNPQGEDTKILAGRNDDKFSQKVRNLKSHGTLAKHGYAKYENAQKIYSLTPKGQQFLNNNLQVLGYILNGGFNYTDVVQDLDTITKHSIQNPNSKTEAFEELESISEGLRKNLKNVSYERSHKLRKHAIEYFSDTQGLISCRACNFIFEKFYGKTLGQGFIEIHHIKPIFQYEGSDTYKTIQQALENLVPLCSNCHKMVHRKKDFILDVGYLREQVTQMGSKITYA